jgi:hypothetical protein
MSTASAVLTMHGGKVQNNGVVLFFSVGHKDVWMALFIFAALIKFVERIWCFVEKG